MIPRLVPRTKTFSIPRTFCLREKLTDKLDSESDEPRIVEEPWHVAYGGPYRLKLRLSQTRTLGSKLYLAVSGLLLEKNVSVDFLIEDGYVGMIDMTQMGKKIEEAEKECSPTVVLGVKYLNGSSKRLCLKTSSLQDVVGNREEYHTFGSSILFYHSNASKRDLNFARK